MTRFTTARQARAAHYIRFRSFLPEGIVPPTNFGFNTFVLQDKLISALSAFDGRATTLLGEAEAHYSQEPDYIDALIGLSGHDNAMVQSGATWLLKSAFEQGRRLNEQQAQAWLETLSVVKEWSASLHICQCTEYLIIPNTAASAFADWLTIQLEHEKPFVRAWSMHALCVLARQFPDQRERAKRAHDAALTDKAASVRARARNIRLETCLHQFTTEQSLDLSRDQLT